MKARCKKSNHHAFGRYGGRGIKYCERWKNFENFYEDMGKKPSAKHQLDRTNNDGNYEPSNCRWVTPKENSNNRKSSVFIEAFGERKTLSQWADKIGGNRHIIRDRLKKGWPKEMAVSIPANWTMVDLWLSV